LRESLEIIINFTWKKVSFIDEIMGYQVGDYFLFGKCNSISISFIDKDTSGSVEEYASL